MELELLSLLCTFECSTDDVKTSIRILFLNSSKVYLVSRMCKENRTRFCCKTKLK